MKSSKPLTLGHIYKQSVTIGDVFSKYIAFRNFFPGFRKEEQ